MKTNFILLVVVALIVQFQAKFVQKGTSSQLQTKINELNAMDDKVAASLAAAEDAKKKGDNATAAAKVK